jgi:hypothetical protein
MKSLVLFAAFVVASVSAFGQCSNSLFNTIAALEGREATQMTKKEFRTLATKYAALVGEQYDQTVKNAQIAQKLCGLLAEQNNKTKCLDLQPTGTTLQADSFYLAYDSLQSLPYFDSLVFNDVPIIKADNVQDTSNIIQLDKLKAPTKYEKIDVVLMQLRKEGLSPKEARCEVKNRLEANNGKKYDFFLKTEVKTTKLDKIKCDSKPKKINSSLKYKRVSNGGTNKFKVKKGGFKTAMRKLKTKINMCLGTCLK